jgi:hypothetical protein
MVNLKQKSDLILMFYLLSIKNKEELILYVKNYLGDSDEVLKFANDFIKMKANMNSKKVKKTDEKKKKGIKIEF